MGFGPYSPVLTFISDRTPLQVILPTLVKVIWNEIDITWPALTSYEDTGRDPVTYYKLEYNDGVNDYVELTSINNPAVLIFNHILTVPFPANTNQTNYYVNYRVTAKNGVGYGITSTPIAVLTDTYPRQMDIPVITYKDPLTITV